MCANDDSNQQQNRAGRQHDSTGIMLDNTAASETAHILPTTAHDLIVSGAAALDI